MSSDPTAEKAELRRKGRQRLIGAVALALVAVVFIPMLLDPEPRRARMEPELTIPPREGAPAFAVPATENTPESGAKTEPLKGAPGDAPAVSAARPQENAPAAVPEPAAALQERTGEPDAKEQKRAAPRLEGFAVQVGAFKDEATLAQARKKVSAARHAHYTERLDAESGALTRLRAGPFATREAAEKAAAQLKRAGLEVRVVTLP